MKVSRANLTAYEYCGKIIFRYETEGGYFEHTNIKAMARLIAEYLTSKIEQRAGTA